MKSRYDVASVLKTFTIVPLFVVGGIPAAQTPVQTPVRPARQAVVSDTLQWRFIATDADSTPIVNATVRTTAGDGASHTYTTDRAGRVTVVLPSTGWATVQAKGFLPTRIEGRSQGNDPVPRTATFRLRRLLTVVVTDEQQHPVSDATIDIDTLVERDAQLHSASAPVARAKTDAFGRATLAPQLVYVPTGGSRVEGWVVIATTRDQRLASVVPLPAETLTNAAPTCSLTVVPLVPSHIAFSIEPDGRPDAVWLAVKRVPEPAPSAPSAGVAYGLVRLSNIWRDSTHAAATVMVPRNAHLALGLTYGDRGFTTTPLRAVASPVDFVGMHLRKGPNGKVQVVAEEIQYEPGASMPELHATTLDGKPVHLADYRGKVVVLDFWGYWCAPCVMKMPALCRIAKTYRDSNVVVLSIHDASVSSAAEYRDKYAKLVAPKLGATAPAFVELLDAPQYEAGSGESATPIQSPASGATIAAFGISSFPTTMVLDPQGRFVGTAPNVMQLQVDSAGHAVPGSEQPPEHDDVLEALIRQARSRIP